jgi:CheY-like chemotaxis protein
MKKRILIIEDNPDHRMLEKQALIAAGCEVFEADNAKDGITLALAEKPDLIVMDIRLPYKSKGIGAAKILRDNEETRSIPIVFVTAYDTFEHEKTIESISNSGFFLKSGDPQALVRYIERFLA